MTNIMDMREFVRKRFNRSGEKQEGNLHDAISHTRAIVPKEGFVFSIGADPEVFFEDREGNLRSAEGMVGGTKQNPRQIDTYISVQEDNVAAEFNIHPLIFYPSGTDWAEQNFRARMMQAVTELAKMAAAKGLNLSTKASGLFPVEEVATEQAQRFGCEPDLNAWTHEVNPTPTPENPCFRSCGGHIHVGFPESKMPKDLSELIRWMDLLLGVPSVLEDPDGDRRKLYGMAGSFRVTPYGVEYRVLSNYWIFDPMLVDKTIRRASTAVKLFNQGRRVNMSTKKKVVKYIQRCINTGNKDMAKRIVSKWIPILEKKAA